MTARLSLSVALAGALAAACGGDPPHSTGSCEGSLFGEDISGPIKPSSEFHRLDYDDGDEDAAVRMVYDGPARLEITAQLAHLPRSSDEGEHHIPDTGENGPMILWWSVNGLPLAEGTVTVLVASGSRLDGSADMSFGEDAVEGAALCTFDLDRDTSKDTDD